MALVAYASSDSGCSDEEDDTEAAVSTQCQTQSVQVVNNIAPLNVPCSTKDSVNKPACSADLTGDLHISDEEDIYPLPASTRGQGLSLPAPKHSAPPENSLDPVRVLADEGGPQSGLLLTGLPQPRSIGMTDGGKEEIMVEDELEDIVKPKQEELALQEKPPTKKTRQPVKIIIPALQGGEEEEEERGPSRKKMKPAPGKSGLLAYLPPPQQTMTKETNRPLIPHTLTKKPAATRRPVQTLPRKEPPSKKTPLLPGIEAADDSDDDDDDDNATTGFFSFGDSGTETAAVKLRPSVDTAQPVGAIAGPAVRPQGPVQQSSQSESETTQADAPLQFRDRADAPLQFRQTQPSYNASPHYGPSTASGWSQSEEQAPQYDIQNETEAYPESEGSDVALLIESDQLLRLQGRRHHGREEIHIIDVHGDDQRSEVEVTRNLTEEQQDMSHSRKKKDMPTRQQKNKHQITYLAYKAKEREFDLKNQWAQNKMTRRQTQAKYGF